MGKLAILYKAQSIPEDRAPSNFKQICNILIDNPSLLENLQFTLKPNTESEFKLYEKLATTIVNYSPLYIKHINFKYYRNIDDYISLLYQCLDKVPEIYFNLSRSEKIILQGEPYYFLEIANKINNIENSYTTQDYIRTQKSIFSELSEENRNDPFFMLLAIESNYEAIKFIGSKLAADHTFLISVCKLSSRAFTYVFDNIRNKDGTISNINRINFLNKLINNISKNQNSNRFFNLNQNIESDLSDDTYDIRAYCIKELNKSISTTTAGLNSIRNKLNNLNTGPIKTISKLDRNFIIAVKKRDINNIKHWIGKGANPNIRDGIALKIAKKYKNSDIIDYLESIVDKNHKNQTIKYKIKI